MDLPPLLKYRLLTLLLHEQSLFNSRHRDWTLATLPPDRCPMRLPKTAASVGTYPMCHPCHSLFPTTVMS